MFLCSTSHSIFHTRLSPTNSQPALHAVYRLVCVCGQCIMRPKSEDSAASIVYNKCSINMFALILTIKNLS